MVHQSCEQLGVLALSDFWSLTSEAAPAVDSIAVKVEARPHQ